MGHKQEQCLLTPGLREACAFTSWAAVLAAGWATYHNVRRGACSARSARAAAADGGLPRERALSLVLT